MSEFSSLIKEFLVGEALPEQERSRAALQAAVGRYDRRLRTLRAITWPQVALTSAAMFLGVWLLATASGDASAREIGIAVALIVFGGMGTMTGKMPLFTAQYHTAIQQELKRAQIRLLDLADALEARGDGA